MEQEIKQKAIELGFHKVGIASAVDLAQSSAIEALQNWLDRGFQADMDWMSNPKRQDIRELVPGAKSIICVALNYYTPQQRPAGKEYAKISRYGWGRDYHRILHKKLKAFSTWLERDGIQTRYFADTAPVQDKFWAQQAGLGWIAKNGNVITREYGSWVFLGGIVTNLELAIDKPHSQHCGTCTRCIDACPTNAITEPFVIDANRCIAYHTIENRAETLPDIDLKGWVAGCDICQDVCPWNQRFAQETDVADFQPRSWNIAPTLQELAEISEEEYDRRFTGSALRRIKIQMLRRNAKANIDYARE
ncbi:tRNA epoxyqueuosine(34) reductase QueG [Pseudanabaenaceae cyanobacterium LEGE 13415]|nr:tRNA epoxyqueuosine(34) reductase QueG [Pseudanabaenaceae cyanobacterium LEGE 13415]